MKKVLLIIAGFVAGRKYEYWVFDGGLDKAKIKFIKKLYWILTGADFDHRYEDTWEKYGSPRERMRYENYNSLRRKSNG